MKKLIVIILVIGIFSSNCCSEAVKLQPNHVKNSGYSFERFCKLFPGLNSTEALEAVGLGPQFEMIEFQTYLLAIKKGFFGIKDYLEAKKAGFDIASKWLDFKHKTVTEALKHRDTNRFGFTSPLIAELSCVDELESSVPLLDKTSKLSLRAQFEELFSLEWRPTPAQFEEMLVRSKKDEHIYYNSKIQFKILSILLKGLEDFHVKGISLEHFRLIKHVNFNCLKITDLQKIIKLFSDHLLLKKPTVVLALLEDFCTLVDGLKKAFDVKIASLQERSDSSISELSHFSELEPPLLTKIEEIERQFRQMETTVESLATEIYKDFQCLNEKIQRLNEESRHLIERAKELKQNMLISERAREPLPLITSKYSSNILKEYPDFWRVKLSSPPDKLSKASD
ncbi:MAG: hypothetical protein LBF33_01490, partial [Oscillospiraceae bacterium]|nr:hypothetical protein [Oscillospiraceae bacterium]